MADSLLNTVKQGSSLFQTAPSTTNQLSQAAGRPTAPTSPVETGVVGGSPQQAAMAGTPAQRKGSQNAIQLPVAPQKSLAATIREQQVSTQESVAQQAAASKAAVLGRLGDSGMAGNVPAMIDKAYQDISSQTGPVRAVADQSKIPSGVDAGKWNDSFSTLTKPGASPTDPAVKQAQVDINNMMGITDPAKMMTAEALQADLSSSEKTIGDALAGHTPETVTLGMLHPEDFGMGSFDEMGQALGLTGAALQKLTVAQLGDVVEKVKSGEFNTEDKWRSLLADPTASVQDRNTARTILRGLGAKGVDVTEANVAKLTAQVKAADRVTFNGTSMTVEQALSSDNVKATVASVLDTNADGSASINTQKMATLAAGSPELAKWITDNANALAAVVKNIPPEQKALAEQQAANSATVSGLYAATPTQANNIMKALMPGQWSDTGPVLSATGITPPALVTSLASATPEVQAAVGRGLSELTSSPDYLKDIASLSVGQLASIGLTDQNAMKVYVTTVKNTAAAAAASANPGASVDSLISSIFGGALDGQHAAQEHYKAQAILALGGKIDGGKAGYLLQGAAEGKVGDIAGAVPRAPKASEMLAGAKPTDLAKELASLKEQEANFIGNNPIMSDVLTAYAQGRGKIDLGTSSRLITQASASATETGHALGGLQQLEQIYEKLGLSTDSVDRAIEKRTDSVSDQVVRAGGGGQYQSFSDLASAVNSLNAGNIADIKQAVNSASSAAGNIDPHIDSKFFPLRGLIKAFEIQQANAERAAAEAAAKPATSTPRYTTATQDLEEASTFTPKPKATWDTPGANKFKRNF